MAHQKVKILSHVGDAKTFNGSGGSRTSQTEDVNSKGRRQPIILVIFWKKIGSKWHASLAPTLGSASERLSCYYLKSKLN